MNDNVKMCTFMRKKSWKEREYYIIIRHHGFDFLGAKLKRDLRIRNNEKSEAIPRKVLICNQWGRMKQAKFLLWTKVLTESLPMCLICL